MIILKKKWNLKKKLNSRLNGKPDVSLGHQNLVNTPSLRISIQMMKSSFEMRYFPVGFFLFDLPSSDSRRFYD